ncbi:MAG: HD domain-containing phosphohydrolase [Chloracidobacterium sp.]|uniref:Response regulator n=1 Tax=Chloracidobacterium validum TaxID=2821543 RepID=A0ABX8BAW9_9BACT|nr:HD domain-containing phosphohydrolase [Chloracidobacterium validum]QUW03557.1 response regulator [Chloracidobacterium validum]
MDEARIRDARILVVDDLELNIKLLENLLAEAGYRRVFSTTDARQVAELYRELSPDLVLLDLHMPHRNGFQVMEDLREIERDSYIPVLVLTGLPDHATRLRALEAGARDFLSKPFEHIEALTRIRNMIEVRLLHNDVREQNRHLEEKVRERTHQLRETQLEIVRRLGRAAEYRDNVTGMHVIRMSHYCAELARAIGWKEEACEMLLHASPMHDIGKIGIPDRILLKEGKLTAEEWEVMKSHAAIGAELLSGSTSPLMQMAMEIALSHHEKWDGSGYPQGLKGEEIPIVGRIVALCDVFDALTTERPYKQAWPVEDVIAELDRQSGKHFDPDLVETFKSILPKILQIRERYTERAATAAAKYSGSHQRLIPDEKHHLPPYFQPQS